MNHLDLAEVVWGNVDSLAFLHNRSLFHNLVRGSSAVNSSDGRARGSLCLHPGSLKNQFATAVQIGCLL